ncbi:hypothetical protein BZ163_06850, partial [Pseudomonas sp. VI4.1]
YLIAEWAHRKGRPTLPESVQAWSQPLPPEQWAQPSPALRKANALVKTAMDKKRRELRRRLQGGGAALNPPPYLAW